MRRLAVALAACLLALAGAAGAAEAPTKTPGELVVALSMPAAGFQVGAVRGRDVVLARGLEIELARAIGRRLEVRRVRFVNEALFSRLVAAGEKDWDLALAEITVLPERAKRVDFSTPYMSADQGVLLRKGLTKVPRTLADLAALRLCSERASTGAQLIVRRILPTRNPLLVLNPTRLQHELFTGRCDAAVYDAPVLGAMRSGAPDKVGVLAGRIRTGERYAAALEEGSPLRPSVNRAIAALLADGTIARLQRKWLTSDVSKLPVLR